MYKIKLEHFEGPLDLLLFFIKRDEINIYDIPISKITKEFLEYVNLIKFLDLETAGEFILMASTLMHIKARMLLPKEFDEKGEEIDPRADLVKALLEYKRYKEMAEELSFLESNQRKISFRGNFSEDISNPPDDFERLLGNITVYDLAKVFKRVIDGIKAKPVHQIRKINVSVTEQMEFILKKMENHTQLHFLSLVDGMKQKIVVIVTFIALLELVKSKKLGLRLSDNFNDFLLVKINE
jgi:segregation and condensation protein A